MHMSSECMLKVLPGSGTDRDGTRVCSVFPGMPYVFHSMAAVLFL